MAKQLAAPADWIEPSLRQAWADYTVASKLLLMPIEGQIHARGVAVDATMDKFQQAFEKLLKVIILAFVPERSDLVFSHRILPFLESDDRRARHLKGTLKNFFKLTAHTENPGRNFRMIERLIPDPTYAECDENGRIVRMPMNTQYAYTGKKGKPVAPCDDFPLIYDAKRMAEIEKDIRTLFRMLTGMNAENQAKLPGLAELKGEWT